MPVEIPAARSNAVVAQPPKSSETDAPQPVRIEQAAAPASMRIELQPPAVVAKEPVAPASAPMAVHFPASVNMEAVAPGAAQKRETVAPASAPTKVQIPAPVNVQAVAPAPPRKEFHTPEPLVSKVAAPARVNARNQTRTPPLPTFRNLLCFQSLDQVVTAIEYARESAGENGGRFCWSRASEEPTITIASLDDLTNAVFGEQDAADFDVEAFLKNAIDKLPPAVAAKAKGHRTALQLEGLWVQFAGSKNPSPPRLGIAVSIDLSDEEPELGPFSMQRVCLKLGDFA